MQLEKFHIEGPLLIKGQRHHDERGFFSETYQASKYAELGLPDFVQDNLSQSSKGVFRGLHWQVSPNAQGKLVTCLAGSIIDYVMDIRPGSETFMQWLEIPLDSNNLVSVWVPEGFAHGFLSLEDGTLVSYKVNNFWSPECERSLNPNLVEQSFQKYSISDPIISEKDKTASTNIIP